MAEYYGFTLDVHVSVRPFVRILFPDDNLSKQRIFTKIDMCIGIVGIWLGIANGQISSIFVICPRHDNVFTLLLLLFFFIYFFLCVSFNA